MAKAKMKPPIRMDGFNLLLILSLVSVVYAQLNLGGGIQREVFFLNLEDGYFGCQVNNSAEVLQLFELSKLCDGTPNCFLGSDENIRDLKCTNTCPYTQGKSCVNGACLEGQCHCNDGYGGCGCEKLDENECKYRPCDIFAACTNTLGSFTCSCFPGYQGDGLTCKDIDECQDPAIAAQCVQNAWCCNLPAHYTCKCNDGFTGNGYQSCTDINECAAGNMCGINAICNNLPGNYTCTCPDGYMGNPYDGCVDFDECSARENMCGPQARCTNREGGYECICPLGYEGDPHSIQGCFEINECAGNPCAQGAKCQDGVNNFTCSCPPGFYGDPYSPIGQCLDIDECQKNPCGNNAICTDNVGSYTCACEIGYTGNPYHGCQDIDECSTLVRPCGPNAICRNMEPGHECSCPQGYEPNPTAKEGCSQVTVNIMCTSNFDCVSNAVCINRYCACREGFSPAGASCIDINECQHSPCGPDATCNNIPGSYQCSCNIGFIGNPPEVICRAPCDGVQCTEHSTCQADGQDAVCVCNEGYEMDINQGGCVDTNECDASYGPFGMCGQNSYCENNIGNYHCSCPPGFTGDPSTQCIDVDECARPSCGYGAICTNTPGSFTCQCPTGTVPEPDPFTECLEIMKCSDDNECPGNALCLARQCMCPEPNIGDDCRHPCEDIQCGPNAGCKLINGVAKCLCVDGYAGIPASLSGCIDIDECLNIPCAEGAICSNKLGSFTCECPTGFEGNPTHEGCVQMRSPGCGLSSPCPHGEQCIQDEVLNENVCICQRGYSRDEDGNCRDINECIETAAHSTCGFNANCKNLPGSYDCQCPPGFVGNPFHACTRCDTLECKCQPPYKIVDNKCVLTNCSATNTCPRGAECVTIQGGVSYCACPSGFTTLNDGSCQDVDECSTRRPDGSSHCGVNAECRNKVGNYECVCPPGTSGDPLTGCATDRIQCASDSDCRKNERCVQPGKCVCQPPYFTDSLDHNKCKSPCDAFTCGINSQCSPSDPPTCLCLPGYTSSGLNGCIDIDECRTNPCALGAICLNEVGTYKCECPIGTEGNPYETGCQRTVEIIPGCSSHNDCPSELKCNRNNGKCINPCDDLPCGRNAFCEVQAHVRFCRCMAGYTEGQNGECISMCDGFLCGQNAKCIVANDGPTCKCLENYQGNPFPGGYCNPDMCSSLNPCIEPQVCVNGRCKESCEGVTCGIGAKCDRLTNKCICTSHFVGDPYQLCVAPTTQPVCSPGCGKNAHCQYDVLNICICNSGYVGNPYESCSLQTEKVTCQTFSCGENAECREGNNRIHCICPLGFKGNPFIKCEDLDECMGNVCATNAKCINTPGSFDCRCINGFTGNPFEYCGPISSTDPCDNPEFCKCNSNSDCATGFICQNGQCSDSCVNVNCGPNAACIDNGVCRCVPGFAGNPKDLTKGCQVSLCSNNFDCNDDEICFSQFGQRVCMDACRKLECGPNSKCVTQNHRSSCLCIDGFVPTPAKNIGGCQPEQRENICEVNSDCPQGQSCQVDQQGMKACIDPCFDYTCDQNEMCSTRDGRPVCECRLGYIRNPLTKECRKPAIPDCRTDSDCPSTSACKSDELGVLKCINACKEFTCGLHSVCVAHNHRGQCQCKETFTGNPNDRSGCRPIPEDQCESDAQCAETEVCRQAGVRKKCLSICLEITCGPGAVCIAKNHAAQCQCPSGLFVGNPEDKNDGCHSVNCLINEDCPDHQACDRLSYKCFDVCHDACGDNAICIPENHRYNCKCPPRSKPNPSAEISCDPIRLCSPSPCHPSEICTETGGSYTCSCPHGMRGDLHSAGCYLEGTCPNGNQDCPQDSICSNERCISPCDGACGHNMDCSVNSRRPICTCKPGFSPNEEIKDGCSRTTMKCTNDAQCLGGVCINSVCHPVCRIDSECADNEKCINNMCRVPCISSNECPSDQACLSGLCVVGCRSNSECPSDKACINNNCHNPCSKEGVCGPNAECRSNGHEAICDCPAGFHATFPSAQQGCIRVPSPCVTDNDCPSSTFCDDGVCMAGCKDNRECAQGEHCSNEKCMKVCFNEGNCLQGEVCIGTSCVPGCRTKTDCSQNQVCVSNKCLCAKGYLPGPYGCVDVDECKENPCDRSAECINVPGSFQCSCPPGTVRDKVGKACVTPNECNTDDECPGSQACSRDSNGARKCVDPCGSAVCGGNAICRVVDRKPLCVCKPGHYGDPSDLTIGCVSGECLVDGDCPQNRICDSNSFKCIDPCQLIDCRYGRCQTVNHKPSCICENGFIVSTSTGSCVDINECLQNPCHRTATCQDSIGSYTCSCPANNVGDPYTTGCKSSEYCTSNNDCPLTSACLNNKCTNPCDERPCGEGAECQVSSHTAQCYCPPLTIGDPSVGCKKVECDDKISFCQPGFNCIRNKCIGICEIPGSCGKNAECNFQRGEQMCTCKPGYTGDPNLGCTLVTSCEVETDCPSGEQCNGGICVPSCTSNRECLRNQVCISGYCTPTCKSSQECPQYQVCQNNICIPEVKCQRDNECRNSEQCRQNAAGQAECEPVCNNLIICGRNAQCVAENHKAVCQCPENYYGDPMDEKIGCRRIQCEDDKDCGSTETCLNHQCKVACHVKNDCGTNALCVSENHKAVCFCRNGFTGDPLRQCSAIDFCDDNPCGAGARCANFRGNFRCTCPRGTVGDAYSNGCETPEGYCDNNNDCPTNAFCNKDNSERRCRDVCENTECGTNAECKAINHQAICRCRSGYEGDPQNFCRPEVVKCSLTSDCPQNTICDGGLCRPPCQSDAECRLNEACLKGQCTNLCDQDSSCGLNAECRVVNHKKQCSCPSGFTGDPTSECYRMPSACRRNSDCGNGYSCKSGVCTAVCTSDKSCALNEKCIQGMCLLTCRLDNDCFLGHICLNNMCLIGCRANSDCASTEGCINSKCSDPCRSGTVCGPNAECREVNHRAQCFCPSGFISHPTPNTACVREPVSCSVNAECRKGFVCDNGNCAPICSSNDNCLSNEKCDGSVCQAICSFDDDCRSEEICKNAVCVVGCKSNSDCPSMQGCINRKCEDPCKSPNACGRNAECTVTDHESDCKCPDDYVGDPFEGCRLPPTTCEINSDCPARSTCIGGTCRERCSNNLGCSVNENCIGGVCKEICNSNAQCGQGHICLGRICIEGCRSDSSCSSSQACINRKCRDPCEGGSACGACATCQVVDHVPQCSCSSNAIGNPLISCKTPHRSCSSSKPCRRGETCDAGYCFEQCSSSDDCKCGEKCSDGLCRPECDETSDCNQGLLCRNDICVAGCRSNSNCPSKKACINNRCTDPCDEDPCGTNAECRSSDHRVLCICPNGYHGDAYVECLEYECQANEDCSNDKACINRECKTPCIAGACASNAQCKPDNHKAVCTCPTNHYGNPYINCQRDINECLQDPCANNAYCTNSIGSYQCTCNSGCIGDAYADGCICSSSIITCETYECGINAKCRTFGEEIECYCPSDYPVGNPENKCSQDCRQTGCVSGANCKASIAGFHECTCNEGWNGDPYVECSPGSKIQCRQNEECAENLACVDAKCVNPCSVEQPCPPKKTCSVINHQPVCICDKECQPSVTICLKDSGCPTSQACVSYQCVDPCEAHVCPGDSPCYVQDHQPLCKFCPPGFTVDENDGCVPDPSTPAIGSNVECIDHKSCGNDLICSNGHCVNPCIKQCGHSTCTIQKSLGSHMKIICIKEVETTTQSIPNIAKTLNPEFPNNIEEIFATSTKKPKNDKTTSKFTKKIPFTTPKSEITTKRLPFPTLPPFIQITESSTERPTTESKITITPTTRKPHPILPPTSLLTHTCTSSLECKRNEACIDNKCTNPCASMSPCSSGFTCLVINHRMLCRCPTESPGNSKCPKAEGCRDNSECPPKQACINELCQNPCVSANPCQPNDDCSIEEHVAICREVGCRANSNCPSTEACINKQCTSPCKVDDPCEAPEECEVRDHMAYCISKCTCSSNSDCSSGSECDGCVCRYVAEPKQTCDPPCRGNEICDPIRQVCIHVPVQPRGCSSDLDCPDDKVCFNRDCRDPCNIANPCGANAKCQTQNHRPVCSCLPGYKGDPKILCSDDLITEGCSDNTDCPSTQACSNNVCRYPCDDSPCKANAECINSRHTAQCRCRNGYEGDPYIGCTPVGCASHKQCPTSQECYSGQCVNPCRKSSNPCPSSATCHVVAHSATCMCPPGTTGIPLRSCFPLPSCGFNTDCPQNEACLDRICTNPCLEFTCMSDMSCRVINHRPVCKCPHNHLYVPGEGCKKEGCTRDLECKGHQTCTNGQCIDPCIDCGSGAICEVVKGHTVCLCPPGTTGNPMSKCNTIPGYCTSDAECQLSEACLKDSCQDPCTVVPPPCGRKALCRVINHRTICQCPDGYVGDPRENCVAVTTLSPGCQVDDDCPYNRQCEQRTRSCIDPCKTNPCAEAATCFVTDHRVVCKCYEGYKGNPYIECVEPSDDHCENCPPNLACINNKCVNPCNCAPNAHCEVQDHRAICSCPPGYKGNPLYSCIAVTPRDPCNNACGENALCELDNGNPICFCPKTMTGNPFIKCIQEGEKCEEGACGPNSDCRIINGVMNCFCLPEYIGDPPLEPCHRPRDLCSPSPCGKNTNCHVLDDHLRCTCKEGYVGSPNTIRGCNTPINPCVPSPCGIQALCNRVGPPLCSCRPGLVGDPYIECKRPPPICQRSSCGSNAECYVDEYELKCRCLEGYEGNPHIRCSPLPKNPCEPSPCGNNAYCRVGSNKRAYCVCFEQFFGDPFSNEGCKSECTTDRDCASDKACVNTRCRDPCVGACGFNANCEVHTHRPVCSCINGYEGNPFVECTTKPPKTPFIPESKTRPCDPSPCGFGAKCSIQGNKAVCSCLRNYKGDPYKQCTPECVVNADCSTDKACINKKCRDPCPGVCGINAECEVDNHNPICYCPKHLTGDPFTRCKPFDREPPPLSDPCIPNPCGRNSECRTSNGIDYKCECISGYFGSPCRPECTVNSDCAQDRSCQNLKCIDPCPGTCGLNAICRGIAHQPVCRCPDGLTGDPFTQCEVKKVPLSPIPSNPCQPSPCGPNADCDVIRDRPVCTCYAGFYGEAPNCRHECVTNSHCSKSLACINNECKDPCIGICGTNAACEVVNHIPNCFCPERMIGDPYVSCVIALTSTAKPPSPCAGDRCGPNANCKENGITHYCSCLPNYKGSPPDCRPECIVSSECRLYLACINNRCLDPCDGLCGVNADCSVQNHNPICSCSPGYTGDPFKRCTLSPIAEKTTTTSPPIIPVPGESGITMKPISVATITDDDPYEPYDPCDDDPCGSHTNCRPGSYNNYICECKPGYFANPTPYQGCRPECLLNSHCGQRETCENQKCVRACPGKCADSAICDVVNHRSKCSCPSGFIGDPFERCYIEPISIYTTPSPPTPVAAEPCANDPCGRNAECIPRGASFTCRCIPNYFGNPYEECKPECTNNDDCPFYLACRNQKCVDLCPGLCGANAHCKMVVHEPICTCTHGYFGDPYDGCRPRKEPEIQDHCEPNPCGPNSKCTPKGSRPACECLPGYFNQPPNCRPECVDNDDCISTLACINQKCQDPCPGVCGVKALCEVRSHNPICFCPKELTGDPFTRCRPFAVTPAPEQRDPCKCGEDAECVKDDNDDYDDDNDNYICRCPPYHYGNPYVRCRPECVVNSDCPKYLACENKRCLDPCPNTCGIGAICDVYNHKPQCTCPYGMIGDPLDKCVPEPREPDVICDPNPCGPYTVCGTVESKVSCNCLAGYPGHPESSCAPECTVNSDCPLSYACINRLCVDPCIGACDPRAECLVREHHPRCRCPDGFIGNPLSLTGCREKPVRDPCSECGINAECIEQYDRVICKCLPNFFGDPYKECNPECLINQDCNRDEYCISMKCVNPCPEPCGIDAICRMQNHRVSCSCPIDYTGDPLIRCTKPPIAPPEPECRTNGECSDHLACIELQCKDPCPIYDICAPNAQCTVRGHYPVCTCPDGYIGDPRIQCFVAGCRANTECPTFNACINEQCRDPCEFLDCGLNAFCEVENHRGRCKCLRGYEGDPYVKCLYPECIVNEDCPTYLACIHQTCQDPCNCGIGADCRVINHKPHCTCPSGYAGDPLFECVPVEMEVRRCQIDADCPSKLACFENGCDDPCHVIQPCAENARCGVIDTLPYRSMVCTCLPGYEGDAKVRCLPKPREPEGCTTNDECGLSEICRNHLCIDPCRVINPCAANAECQVRGRDATCSCPPGLTGDPRINCYTIAADVPECVVDRDCTRDMACFDGKCGNPCIVRDPCGKDAMCEPQNHRPVCYCPDGWFGKPTVQCFRAECEVDTDCPTDRACSDHKCVDVCSYRGTPCGLNAQCRGVLHQARCYCPSGTQGNPQIACVTVGCVTNADCDDDEACDRLNFVCVDVCSISSCAPEADCEGRDHVAHCTCPPGYEGNAFVSCFEPKSPPFVETPREPQCTSDSECRSGHICINDLCRDPCKEDDPCHRSQNCRVISDIPKRTIVCECPPNQILMPGGVCMPLISVVPECQSDDDCHDDEWCRGGVCRNVCEVPPCGLNAICRGFDHRRECSCSPGFHGDPYSSCMRLPPISILPQPECTTNGDCSDEEACINQMCVNPCMKDDPCARDAFCFVKEHRPICRCPKGFTGDPKIECSPIEIPIGVGCKADMDCPINRACINTKCIEPCDCGPNAECIISSHRPVCRCLEGYQGDPKTGCYRAGCTEDRQCPTDTKCYNGVCANPCFVEDPCPITAECYAEEHQAKCRCPPGLEGDPYVRCLLVGCRQNSDCPSNLACTNRMCFDPCLYSDLCAPNAECFVSRHTPGCRCPADMPYGDPRTNCHAMQVTSDDPPICRVDGDCPSQHACLSGRCVNPCYYIDPCNENAMCKVVDSLPVRTMICYCPDGYVIDENGICKVIELPKLVDCRSDSECPSEKACVNSLCKDPCDCGPNADCTVVGHRSVCECQVGFQGQPEIGCFSIGCEANNECDDDKACYDGVCVNPCLVDDPCAVNAECYAKSHIAMCRCPIGLMGDGFNECLLIGCRSHSECDPERACINNQCTDPCLDDSCDPSSECVPLDHRARCRCPPGTYGDAYLRCDPIPREVCYMDADCSSQQACLNSTCVNPCEKLEPCDPSATCKVLDTLPLRTMICVCPDGMVVQTDGVCRTLPPIKPMCESNSECPSDQACINGFCKDPCTCGKSANCDVVENHPVCTCFEGFEGDPLVECRELVCYTRRDCESTHSCKNGQCVPVCGPDNEPCGDGAICQGIEHEAKCFCPPGLRGNPNSICNAIGCAANDNCPDNLACRNERCLDPCDLNPCIPPAKCFIEDHVATCPCPVGYNTTLDHGCQEIIVGCTKDSDCPSEMACVNEKCISICALEPCGKNAECSVIDTHPIRTAICECLPGYQGDAAVECFRVPVCPIDKGYTTNEQGECVCPHERGFYVDENGNCRLCELEKGFVLTEDGRCICDPVKGYVLTKYGTCDCPLTHERNRNGVCVFVERPDLPEGCVRNDECPKDKMCQNRVCVPPCSVIPCSENAICINSNHTVICHCLSNYTGDPYDKNGCVGIRVIRTDFPQPQMQVNCLRDGVQIDINIFDRGFNGLMYVKGYSKNEECRKIMREDVDIGLVVFKVKFGTCGVFHENGLAKFVLVVQKHPTLVTYKAQAYHIRCTYSTGEKTISMGFNVSMLTTAGTIANTGPPPVCLMKITNQNGGSIDQAQIGDLLLLRIEVEPSDIYGGFARNCYALTTDDQGETNQYLVTDDNGCATDPIIFQEWDHAYEDKSLSAPFSAFKFPSSNSIHFRCNVRVCFGRCQPVNCDGYDAFGKRKKRQVFNPDAEFIYEEEATLDGQLREILVSSQAILTIERIGEKQIQEEPLTSVDEVCVSKWGFIIALIITALLALVAVAVAVSCWLMAYRRRPKYNGPLPHPENFPNPLFTTPEPLAEPTPDYLS